MVVVQFPKRRHRVASADTGEFSRSLAVTAPPVSRTIASTTSRLGHMRPSAYSVTIVGVTPIAAAKAFLRRLEPSELGSDSHSLSVMDRISSTDGILVQPEIYPGPVVLGISPTRIPVMVKSRAYTRPQKPEAEAPLEKTNFVREWRERPTEEFPGGMSQEALSERSGLSVSSISAYERMTNDPSIDALQKLSNAFGVPRGMILDVDPRQDAELWDAYQRADASQRAALCRIAAGLVPPRKKRRA